MLLMRSVKTVQEIMSHASLYSKAKGHVTIHSNKKLLITQLNDLCNFINDYIA